MPAALDNGQLSPRKLLRAGIARLLFLRLRVVRRRDGFVCRRPALDLEAAYSTEDV
jgi:hypothetical protein